MRFDAQRNAFISYYDVKCKALKLIQGVPSEAGYAWQPIVKTGDANLLDCGPLEENLAVIRGQIVDLGPRAGQGVGYFNWLLLDRDARPHVVYYDGDNRQLKYAWATGTNPDGTWEFKKVFLDSSGSAVGKWLTAALDEATPQNLHVAYVDSEFQKVKYLRWNRSWDEAAEKDRPVIADIELVDLGNVPGQEPTGKPLAAAEGSRVAVAISPGKSVADQDIYVLYYSSSDGDLRLATRKALSPRGTAFAISILDDLPKTKASGSTPELPGDLTPDNVGLWPAAIVDPNGILHIAYVDDSNKDLKYLLYSSKLGKWFPRYQRVKNFDVSKIQVLVELLDPETVETETRVVSEQPLRDLSLSTGTTVLEEWVGEVVIDGSGAGTGVAASITLDPFNRAILSYRDGTTGDLRIAFQDSLTPSVVGHSWITVPLDDPRTVGMWSSVEVIAGEEPQDWALGISYQGFQLLETGARRHVLMFRYFDKLEA